MVIPEALSDGKRWLLWREEVRKGKPTKVPYCPDGRCRASSTDPDTWGSLDEARSTFTRGGFDGIGVRSATAWLALISMTVAFRRR